MNQIFTSSREELLLNYRNERFQLATSQGHYDKTRHIFSSGRTFQGLQIPIPIAGDPLHNPLIVGVPLPFAHGSAPSALEVMPMTSSGVGDSRDVRRGPTGGGSEDRVEQCDGAYDPGYDATYIGYSP